MVPAAVLLRPILGASPLHIDTVDGVALIAGVGLTVTVDVVLAVQLLAVPVMV